jgi:hypothetical protein
MDGDNDSADGCSAWDPGIEPGIPTEYWPLETIFWPESAANSLDEVLELAQLSGLFHEELVEFRPERLVLHELIVRVTAEIVVAEGPVEEAFGWNFRKIVSTIDTQYIAPQLADLRRLHAELRQLAGVRAGEILAATLFGTATEPAPPARRFPLRLFGASRSTAAEPPDSSRERQRRIIAGYLEQTRSAEDPFDRAVYRSLYRVLGCMSATRGWVGSDQALLVKMVCTHVGNSYGSQLLGQQLDPLVDRAIEREGYTRIRNRDAPILISLKGASAAGKSSLRPMLKQLMREQGIEPDGYATISPDVWRRALLDYDGLGPAYKYSGPLTSREVMVIDGKLDRYIRRRAVRDRSIPHFLVDRFRFDSFSSEKVARVLHNTYAKYVDTMYMYFVVTAPEETVKRGWQRGLERGRYKAVEDFLGHSVEAYVGMPRLLFKWLSYQRPRFRYFFLDNMVPRGTFPHTIAAGTQEEMTVYRPLGLVDIERYQKIDIKARSPAAVYPPAAELAVERNCSFLRQCLKQIPLVNFVDAPSGVTYARTRAGRFEVVDDALFDRLTGDAENARLFRALAPQATARVS